MSDKEQDCRKTPADAADLRQRAEAQAGAAEPVSLSAQTPEAIEQLIHELRVHQIELEMQNEELRTAQAEIEAGQARYFDLYDLAPVGYIIVSEEVLILEANLTVTTLLGVNRGALIKQPLTRFILEEDQDIYYLHRKKLFDTGEPQSCELRLVKPDGSAFWAWLDGAIAEGSNGKPVCRVVLSDITERKKAEDTLRETKDLYLNMFEKAPFGYQSLDENGNFLLVNEPWLKTLGYQKDEVIGKWFGDFLAPDYVEAFRERFPLFKKEGKIRSELAMVNKKGHQQFIVFEGIIGNKADGSFERTHCVLKDITEQKEAEKIIMQHQAELSAIYENAPLIMMLVDSERKVQKINGYGTAFAEKAMEEILGKRGGEALGCLYALEHPEGCGKGPHCAECTVRLTVLDTIETGQTYHQVEASLPFLVDGVKEQLYFLLSTVRLTLPERQLVLVSLLDISDLKKAEAEIRKMNEELEKRVGERTTQLEAVNKELESFAYSISHDFRAPLRALDGFSASLQTKYDEHLDDEGRHYLDRIRNAAIYMSNLVDDLLNLSRITRQEFKQQQVDLSKLVAEIFAALQEAEPERKARFKIAPDLQVRGDAALLQSALQNLLENAWKFSSKEVQAEIEVGRTTVEGEAVFFVRDNGVGFDMAYAKNLFGAFQRLHKVGEFPGTGIGLATVQRIINRHGGRIWAESEVGKGATFYFTLQALAPEEPTKASSKT